MFNLIYRDGAPENTRHYEVFRKATGRDTGLKVGTLVYVENGKAIAFVDGKKPYGVVAINAADGEDTVAVLKIADDMIFVVRPQEGNVSWSPENVVGQLHSFDADSVNLTLRPGETQGYAFEVTEVVEAKLDNTGHMATGGVVKGRFVYNHIN